MILYLDKALNCEEFITMKNIAIVICNFNKKDFVLDCIESVFQSSFTDFDLIVVDNASTDGSVEAIGAKYGNRLTILVNEENTGGSGGFHRGMAHAMQGNYRYIHLLDNDVVIDRDAIGSLFDFMESHPETGACGSLVCKAQLRDYIQDYGATIDFENLGMRAQYGGVHVDDDLPAYTTCDYIAACSAMYRVAALKKTHIMQEDYFIYWDDVAMSWELRLAGYQVCAYAKSKVWHYGTWGNRTAFVRYYMMRNRIYCFTKYLDDEQFRVFKEKLFRMVFRTFAVNRNRPDVTETYFHAVNDALNNIRWKADPFKLVPPGDEQDAFDAICADKKRILFFYDPAVSEVDRLIARVKRCSRAEIDIFAPGQQPPIIEGVNYPSTVNQANYDLLVQSCFHILDCKQYDRSKVYVDKFENYIIEDQDFDFYQHLNLHQNFFTCTYHSFMMNKLDHLRSQLRKAM